MFWCLWDVCGLWICMHAATELKNGGSCRRMIPFCLVVRIENTSKMIRQNQHSNLFLKNLNLRKCSTFCLTPQTVVWCYNYYLTCKRGINMTTHWNACDVYMRRYVCVNPGWKKCVPCKDLARFSFKVLQDNAFFCKTSCKNLARKKISLQNFVEGSRQFFLFFIFIVFDFKLTTASWLLDSVTERGLLTRGFNHQKDANSRKYL